MRDKGEYSEAQPGRKPTASLFETDEFIDLQPAVQVELISYEQAAHPRSTAVMDDDNDCACE